MRAARHVGTTLAMMALAAAGTLAQAGAEKHWSAQWITAAHAAERDEAVLHFRKVVELPELPKEFLVDVSADNQFILYVNGNEVMRGPSRADLAHWRYETRDIRPWLHTGRNVLSALVWHFGTHAAIAQMSERTGFLLHGTGETARTADTNDTWEVEEEKGITTLKPHVNGYYAAEPGLRVDGAKFDWDANGESKGEWTKAVTLGRGALREERDAPNNWQLVSDPLPAMQMAEVPAGKVLRANGIGTTTGFPRVGFTVAAHSKARVLIDNGQLTTGYPALLVSEGRGATIRLTYAEALYDEKGQKGNRNEIDGKHIEGVADEFLPGGGDATREFMPLSWRTWRYLQLEVETADAPVKVERLKTIFSAYPFAEKAYFHSNESSLEQIWTGG